MLFARIGNLREWHRRLIVGDLKVAVSATPWIGGETSISGDGPDSVLKCAGSVAGAAGGLCLSIETNFVISGYCAVKEYLLLSSFAVVKLMMSMCPRSIGNIYQR
jgi:hypothetical protein